VASSDAGGRRGDVVRRRNGAGYFDIRKWDQTGDDKAAGGIIPFVWTPTATANSDARPVVLQAADRSNEGLGGGRRERVIT